MKKTKDNFGDVLLRRREFLQGLSALTAWSCAPKNLGVVHPLKLTSFDFSSLSKPLDHMHHLADGYTLQILISWGDSLFDSSEFDWKGLTGKEQSRRFGYNNDFTALVRFKEHWLLMVNHESTSAQLMFEGEDRYTSKNLDHVAIEMAAHGGSIIEIDQSVDGEWSVIQNSPFNRRITVDTLMRISGPVAGHDRMKTPDDPSGNFVRGMVHNCSGGVTPWGTILTCEENILYYFGGEPKDSREMENYKRYNIGYSKAYSWYKIENRFDVQHAPKQPNKYGWVVEIDPTDPESIPVKRTALGRFYHESANPILNADGRVVIYLGDDGYFEYLYRFVSTGTYHDSTQKGLSQGAILDDGELSVALFKDDGILEWIPLIFGTRGLTREDGFLSQEDVLIEARRAGDIVGATPMDRCEDVEPNSHTNRIYVNCTLNPKRGTTEYPDVNPSNPRRENLAGHTIEIIPPKGNHTVSTMTWDMLILAGDETHGAKYGESIPEAYFACPDNAVIDPQGRLWITTDGASKVLGIADGIYAIGTEGEHRGGAKRLFSAPEGAEVTGPSFSPDGKSLFLSIQHPGKHKDGRLTNRWPDFKQDRPARPSVVVIRREDGGVIGGES